MAVLGQHGIVKLSREWPAPTALADERLQHGASPSLHLNEQAFQSGDEVLLVSLRGVPLAGGGGQIAPSRQLVSLSGNPLLTLSDQPLFVGSGIGGDEYAPCPDGHAFWPDSGTAIGPALAARTADGGFWGDDPSAPFWESANTVGFVQGVTAFINRDELDDVRFYSTEIDAINGGATGLVPMRNVHPGPMLILPSTTEAKTPAYFNAAIEILTAIEGMEIADGEQAAGDLAPLPAILVDTAADAEKRGWLIQCDLTGWVFEMDATQLDADAIGQAFGESAKGMLRGAGSFNGEVDHSWVVGEQSGLGMLRLMMLTAQGSKARAQFQLMDQRTATAPLVRERVFYETDILIGKTSVTTDAANVIQLSAQFVATGKIKLAKQSAP